MHSLFRPRLSVTGLLVAAGAVATIASIGGLAGRYWWFLDLASHFRVQYAIVLSFVTLTLCALRAYRAAILFALVALLNLAFVLPLYVGSPDTVGSPARSLRAMLINVYTSNTDYAAVLETVITHDPDFVIVEEINERWAQELQSLRERYQYVVTHPREDNFGIALFSKHAMVDSEVLRIGDIGLPSILAQFDVHGNRFFLLGTHAVPPVNSEYARERNKHLSEISRIVAVLDAPVVVLGDLNVSPWSYHFRQLIRHSGLQDSSRGRGFQATWPTQLFPLLIPIDHCLHSPGIDIIDKSIGPYVGSDHYPVLVDFVPL